MDQKVKLMQVIHIALVIGVSLIYFVLGNVMNNVFNFNEFNISSIPFLTIPIIAVFAGNFMFKNVIKTIKEASLQHKLVTYQTASIIRWAILEGASMIILLIKPDLILIGICLIFYMAFLRPTKEKIIQDLQLKTSDFK